MVLDGDYQHMDCGGRYRYSLKNRYLPAKVFFLCEEIIR